MKDKLDGLFDKQIKLQDKICGDHNKLIGNQEFINIMTLAAIDEMMEALRETPFKPWKKQQRFNKIKFKEEIIDLWHFVINLSIAADMDPNEIYHRYLKKNKKNFKRQEEGY